MDLHWQSNVSAFKNYIIEKTIWRHLKPLLLLLSHFSRVRLCATPQTAAHQAPLSLGFTRQEHWSGVPSPSPKESWVPKNWCFQTVVLEKTLESPLDCKEIQPVHPKENESWIFIGRTDAEAEAPILWYEELTHWKRPWCWERLRARGEGGDRGWDGWMVSPMQWTWTWANSRRWWRTGRPGMLQSMGSQQVGDDWAAELNWIELFT